MSLRSRIRCWVEDRVPWFDRASQVRAHADVQATIRASVATRQVAEDVIHGRRETMRGSFHRGDQRLAGR